MSKFKILVDTSYDLPKGYVEEHELMIVSIPYHLNGVTHDKGIWDDMTDAEFYNALANGGVAGTTLANPEAFVEIFTKCAREEEELLVILLSSGLSGTAQNAGIALEEVKESYPDCKIYLVDTLNAAGGTGFVTMLAVDKRAEGFSVEETAKWLEDKRHSCLALFTVDDLMYLHRGGRLSRLSAVAGSIIGIKPLLNVAPDGTLKLKDKARGRKAALETLAAQVKRSINEGTKLKRLIISHSDCLDDAEKAAEHIKAAVDVEELHLLMMGPVIGAHVGPGCIAVFFEGDMTREAYENKFYPSK